MRSITTLIRLGWTRLWDDLPLWGKLIALQIGVGLAGAVLGLVIILIIAVLVTLIAKAGALVAVGGGLVIIALILIGLWLAVYFGLGAFLAMQVAMSDEETDKGVLAYYAEGRTFAFPALTAWLWAGLLFALSVVLPIAAVVLLISFAKGPFSIPIIVVGAILITTLFFYLVISLIPTNYVVVAEDLGGRAALRKSFALVKGHWWRTFLLFLIIEAITFVIGIAFDVLIGTVGRNSALAAIISLLQVVVSFLTAPWLLAVLWEYYKDLKSNPKPKTS